MSASIENITEQLNSNLDGVESQVDRILDEIKDFSRAAGPDDSRRVESFPFDRGTLNSL